MRRSIPITLTLAAFAMASVCGPASAIMDGPTPSTPKPPVAYAKPKLPAVQNLSTSATTTTAKKKAKAPATQNLSSSAAAVTTTDAKPAASTAGAATTNSAALASSKGPGLTTANAAALTMKMPLGLKINAPLPAPEKTPTPADLKKDIGLLQELLQDYLAQAQRTQPGDADMIRKDLTENRYHWDPKNPSQMKCDADGKCVGYWRDELVDLAAIVPGFGIQKLFLQTFEIPVDKTGAPLPGAADALIAAKKVFNDNQLAYIKEQIAVDYIALNGPRATGGDNIDIPRPSTALHPL